MRRLPIYFLIEASSGMKGEMIHSLENSFHSFIQNLRCRATVIEDLAVSFITINTETKQLIPLTYLSDLTLPIPLIESNGLFDLKSGLVSLNKIIENDKILPYHPRYSGSKPFIILFISRNSISKYEEDIETINTNIDIFISYALRNEIEEYNQNVISKFAINSKNHQLDNLPLFFKWLGELIENRLQHFTEYLIPELPKQLAFINSK